MFLSKQPQLSNASRDIALHCLCCSNSCAVLSSCGLPLAIPCNRDMSMERVKQVGRYFIWCVAAATLVFCLGSLHLFASGLDQITRDMKLDSAPEASLVYDRHEQSRVCPSRTRIARTFPLDRVSPTMVSAVLTRRGSLLLQACRYGRHRPRARRVGRPEGARREAGRQHHHPAAHPTGGADHRSQLPAKNQRGVAGVAGRTPIRQETDSRGVSQSHLPRQRPLRRRGRRARLLREIGRRARRTQKARCLPASFPAPRSARRERRRTSPSRGAIWC